MQIKDSAVMTLIDKIADHYTHNVNNRFLRPALTRIQMDAHSLDLIESFTEKSDYYQLQGYHLDELYERILALAKFIYHARTDVEPNLRNLLSQSVGKGVGTPAGNERVLRDMSVSNFQSNLAVLADLLHDLFVKVVEIDEQVNNHGTSVHQTIPGLRDLGRFLVPG